MLKNTMNKIWNSKAMDILVDVTDIATGTVKCLGEVLVETFSKENTIEETETYRYWIGLTYDEQEEYFNNNEYLRPYKDTDLYTRDRYLTAKHVSILADKLNREFTNKYDRY